MTRSHARMHNQLRPLKITYDVISYCSASVLLEFGKTKVICAVTLQNTVPPFLKGKRVGWLTAEYAMLPTATHTRKERESLSKPNGRSLEISRLIGRALRSVVRLDSLGERTIIIDCDVLQADGSTRTTSITGSFLALKLAVARWLKSGKITEQIIQDDLASVSIGLVEDMLLLDLDFAEDSMVEADFNFVMTRSGKVVEIQGAAEKHPIAWGHVEAMHALAFKGITDIFAATEGTMPTPREQVTKPPFNSIKIRTTNNQA